MNDIRKWMMLCEKENDADLIASLPHKVIQSGVKLWHGTSSINNFTIPKGPAWFASTIAVGSKWAGWTDYPDNGPHGDKRVLEYIVTKEVSAIILTRNAFKTLGLKFFDDEEPSTWNLAYRLKTIGTAGWISRTEIMITSPSEVLRYVRTLPIVVNT